MQLSNSELGLVLTLFSKWKGSDCQRYLYFICEYNENVVVTTSTAEPSTTRTITPSTTVATSTAASTTTAETKRITSKPLTPAPPQAYFTREPNSTKISSTARVKVTRHPRPPVTPNYVGVIGFKDSPREEIAPAKNNNFGSLNLAILSDDIVWLQNSRSGSEEVLLFIHFYCVIWST